MEPWEFREYDIETMIEDYSNIRTEELRDYVYNFILECMMNGIGNSYGFDAETYWNLSVKLDKKGLA